MKEKRKERGTKKNQEKQENGKRQNDKLICNSTRVFFSNNALDVHKHALSPFSLCCPEQQE